MRRSLLIGLVTFLSSVSVGSANVSCSFATPEGTQACFVSMNLIKYKFGNIYSSAPCIGLESRSFKSLINESKAAQKTPSTNAGAGVVPLHKDFSTKGANCSAFISNSNGKGSYGEYGKIIVDYLKERGGDSIFFHNELPGMIEMPQICPRWKKLTKQEKEHFWVYTFAAIAFDESKCIPTAKNLQGTNGIAAGLTQMDMKVSARKWRGPDCKSADIMPPYNNLRCALNIMEALLKGPRGEYKSTGHLFSSGKNVSYWQKLKKPNGGEIGHLIKTNPLCR